MRWILSLGLAALWVFAVPLAFVTLYSVIELQAAARSAGAIEPRLAALTAIDLARKLDAADASKDEAMKRKDAALAVLADASTRRAYLFPTLQEQRSAVRSDAIQTLKDSGQTVAVGQCAASPTVIASCKPNDPAGRGACTEDWQRARMCYISALSEVRRHTDLADARPLLIRDMNQQDMTARQFNEQSERAQLATVAASQSKAKIDEDDALLTDTKNPFSAVSEGYRRLEGLPAFVHLFLLPAGAVVAMFTGLMAGIASGVASLVTTFKDADASWPETGSLMRSGLMSPAIGALAGFMTFFVVSAGTAFLVSSSEKGAIDAINSLSAPALASLGVFAGLAAEAAITWLQTKANAFFKI